MDCLCLIAYVFTSMGRGLLMSDARVFVGMGHGLLMSDCLCLHGHGSWTAYVS